MLNNCNSANYNSEANWNGSTNGNLTTVGLNGKSSYYGTYDQIGNINEILDTADPLGYKKIRGGSFLSPSGELSKNYSSSNYSDSKRNDTGFRIAKNSGLIDADYALITDSNNSGDATNNNYGAVNYTYQIKILPITNAEYTTFLNSVAVTSNFSLWDPAMQQDDKGGIIRSGSSSAGYAYVTKTNMDNKPVNFINWFSAARYVNWLHNGSSSGSSTETGVYSLSGDTVKPNPSNKNSVWIPNEDEWYKAAYYKGAGSNAGYWLYATQSDTAPDSVEVDLYGNPYKTTIDSNCYTPTPTPTPTRTATPTASPTKTPTISITATRTPTKSLSPTKSITPTVTPTRTQTLTKTITRTITNTRTITPTTSPTNTTTPTVTQTRTPTKTVTKTPTVTRTVTITPSKSLVVPIDIGELIYQSSVYIGDDIQVIYKGFLLEGRLVPNVAILSEAPNVTPTRTNTVTPTPTPSISPTKTVTPTVSQTPSNTPSITSSITPSITPSVSITSTVTPTLTMTVTPSITPTSTVSPTPSISISQSVTPTITSTPTISVTPSISITPTITTTPTTSITPTISITPTTSITQTPTITPSITLTPSISITPSLSITPTTTPTITVTPSTPSTNLLSAVSYNDNKSALSSDSGHTWQLYNMTSSKYWTDIIYAFSKFIACGYASNTIDSSLDGITWTSSYLSPTGDDQSSLPNVNNLWTNIFYGNNKAIILANATFVGAISSNSYNWQQIYFPATANWVGGAYGNGVYVIVTSTGTSSGLLAATSTDGITWTQRYIATGGSPYSNLKIEAFGITFINGKFWVVGYNDNLLFSSTDGATWSNASVLTTRLWKKVVGGNGKIVIFGTANVVAVSTNDGASFTEYPIVGEYWNDLIYKNNTFVLIGNNGTLVLTSTDAISWTQRSIASNNWSAVA